jgi:hypothetical protein
MLGVHGVWTGLEQQAVHAFGNDAAADAGLRLEDIDQHCAVACEQRVGSREPCGPSAQYGDSRLVMGLW